MPRPLSIIASLFPWTVFLHTGLSPLQCFPSLSILMPSHVFAAHSWKSHYHCFVAISHFFLFLLLVNCENYFLLQEKMPICLFELESCCSLLAKSRAVVFNAHPEMSIPFCLYKGRNPFDIIYETSCGGGGDPVTSGASPFVAHQQLRLVHFVCILSLDLQWRKAGRKGIWEIFTVDLPFLI